MPKIVYVSLASSQAIGYPLAHGRRLFPFGPLLVVHQR